MTNTLLQIKNLKKSYGKNVALKGITTDIHEGEFVVIIGPSGAGKSTFIRSINKMIDATSGEILFDGESLGNAKGKALRNIRANIGMIFQHYNLINRTSVIKNVLHGRLGQVSVLRSTFGRYPQEDLQEAYELLCEVGLKEQIYKKAGALSGGQMQRVGICRAIMQRPKLLLADEPIASLDPKSAKTVMDYLKKITQERGVTCMVNLHQVDFAKKYATRIIGIHDGQIVFDGTPAELSDDIISEIYDGKEEQMYLKNQQVPLATESEAELVYG